MIRDMEQVSTLTLLGIRFRDAVSGAQIRQGLRVTAWPLAGGRRGTAFRTASDLYAFQGLTGLEDLETGREPLDFAASPGPAPRPFVLGVEDLLGRYLPAALRIDLPLPYPGRYLEDAPVAPGAAPADGLRLFRAPGSRPETWLAAVRGELLDQATDQRAAHARVRVRIDGGPPATGFADALGVFLVVAQLPVLIADLDASPPVVPRPLSTRTWDLSLSVNWAPGDQAPLPGTGLPDYQSLFVQAPARLQAEPAGPFAPVWTGVLVPGVPLVARTRGRSELLIASAPTSP